jgi:AcrR family transcriptional regulator
MVAEVTVLTTSQRARQERMLEVAERLASQGGYDAVQMRTVAAESDVALGTLYRYFPSKEHLLVTAMLRQIRGLADRLELRPAVGDDPVDRVMDVIKRSNAALQRQPRFTLAMVRALVAGEPSVAAAVHEATAAMRQIILQAMTTTGDAVVAEAPLIADILSDVWLSSLVAWLSGSAPAAALTERMEQAARLMLRVSTVAGSTAAAASAAGETDVATDSGGPSRAGSGDDGDNDD